MPSQAFNLTPSLTKKGRVRKNTFQVLIPDATFLAETIQKIAAHEILKEKSHGNSPTNIIVDNRDSKPFNQAQFRVVALFADPKLIAIGASEVIRQLNSVTKRLSGRAQASFEIWTVSNTKDPGKKIMNASAANHATLLALAESLPVGGRLVVVGPLVKYGRKLYWSPKFARKAKGTRARYSAGYDIDSGKLSRVRTGDRDTNMRDLVIGRVRGKYKSLSIIGRWVVGDMVNGDNRWPGIAIGLKSKGSLI
jgi:hypothetical protein